MPEENERLPVMLVVLDGFGLAPDGPGNAVTQAHTPVFDRLWADQPHTTLKASGPAVGLPEGQMGNSEVGHLNLGAGRIVEQSLSFIQTRLDSGELENAESFQSLCQAAGDGTLHLIGLVSDGGVHSSMDHLFGLLDAAARSGVERIRVHVFTDGRDAAPKGGRGFVAQLEEHLAGLDVDARIATVVGRYYAMDRDRRWERTQEAFDALVCGKGQRVASSADEAIAMAYDEGETDEFIRATVVKEGDAPVGVLHDGDAVLFFNFRADRARQLSYALSEPDFEGFVRCATPSLHFATLLPYDAALRVPALLALPSIEKCLAEVLSDARLRQYHTAETEKYPHVTYFFNAKIEEPFPGEERRIVPSPKVATYDLEPQMSAPALAQATVERMASEQDDFVLINFANPDMVGHTGDLAAAIKACEATDEALGRVLEAWNARKGRAIILADHGNAEQMLAPGGGPHTAHTTNPVPFILVGAGDVQLRDGGVLGDVAPTVLALLGLQKPSEMTGRSLIA